MHYLAAHFEGFAMAPPRSDWAIKQGVLMVKPFNLDINMYIMYVFMYAYNDSY